MKFIIAALVAAVASAAETEAEGGYYGYSKPSSCYGGSCGYGYSSKPAYGSYSYSSPSYGYGYGKSSYGYSKPAYNSYSYSKPAYGYGYDSCDYGDCGYVYDSYDCGSCGYSKPTYSYGCSDYTQSYDKSCSTGCPVTYYDDCGPDAIEYTSGGYCQ